jgi:hypothetical protein
MVCSPIPSRPELDELMRLAALLGVALPAAHRGDHEGVGSTLGDGD